MKWKRTKIQTHIKERNKKLDKIFKKIQKDPTKYLRPALTKISKDTKIPVSTIFDFWDQYLKNSIKIDVTKK